MEIAGAAGGGHGGAAPRRPAQKNPQSKIDSVSNKIRQPAHLSDAVMPVELAFATRPWKSLYSLTVLVGHVDTEAVPLAHP